MVLVTGATGLTGSHLLHVLCTKGEKVRALRRKGSDLARVRKLFGGDTDAFSRVEWVDGDLQDMPSLEDALAGVDRVYHCAAFVSYVPAEARQMFLVNFDGTANLVNACLAAGVGRLCHMSSVAAINRNEKGIIHEDIPWKASRENTNYAVSKYGAEREIWRGMAEGLQAVIVNPSIIIGPGDWHRSSDAIFMKIWNGLKFYTEGVTGWVDVRDVVRCMITLADSGISGQRFIVSAEDLPFRTVFGWIADGLRRPRPSVYANALMRGIVWRMEAIRSFLSGKRPLITQETALAAGRRVHLSNEKIKATTGIEFIPVKDAVERTCRCFLEEMGPSILKD